MVKPYNNFLPSFHVPNGYFKMVPLTPYGKKIQPRAPPPYLGPLACYLK